MIERRIVVVLAAVVVMVVVVVVAAAVVVGRQCRWPQEGWRNKGGLVCGDKCTQGRQRDAGAGRTATRSDVYLCANTKL